MAWIEESVFYWILEHVVMMYVERLNFCYPRAAIILCVWLMFCLHAQSTCNMTTTVPQTTAHYAYTAMLS